MTEYEISGEAAADVKLGPIVAVGAVAAAACGAAWAILITMTQKEIGFSAVGVGYVVGRAVSQAAGAKRGRGLQWVAVGCTALGLMLGKYFYVAHLLREVAARQAAASASASGQPGWFDRHVLLFFLGLLPRLTGLYDALWLFLALNVAWRALQRESPRPT